MVSSVEGTSLTQDHRFSQVRRRTGQLPLHSQVPRIHRDIILQLIGCGVLSNVTYAG